MTISIIAAAFLAMRNLCRTDYKGEGRRPDGHYNTVGFRIVTVSKATKEGR
jgi:hypothetical protein